VKAGESPIEAAVRETREESGLEIQTIGFQAFYGKADRELTGFRFCASIIGGHCKARMQSERSEFFPVDNLPRAFYDASRPAHPGGGGRTFACDHAEACFQSRGSEFVCSL